MTSAGVTCPGTLYRHTVRPAAAHPDLSEPLPESHTVPTSLFKYSYMKPSSLPGSLPIAGIGPLITSTARPDDPEWHWLEKRDDPNTKAFLSKANGLFKDAMAPLEELANALFEGQLKRRELAHESLHIPLQRYAYFTRVAASADHPVWLRHPVDDPSTEETLLDLQQLSAHHDYVDVGEMAISPDENQLAWTLDTHGDECFDLYVQTLPNGTPECVIEGMGGDVIWAEDTKSLLYTRLDDIQRPESVWLYDITDGTDTCLYREPDTEYSVGFGKTRSRDWLVIESVAKDSSESHLLPAHAPRQPLLCVRPREASVEYSIDHRPGAFYLLHNRYHRHFQLDIADQESPTDWKPFIPAREESTLEGVDAFAWGLVISERDHQQAQPQLRLIEYAETGDLQATPVRDERIALVEEPLSIALDDSVQFHERTLRLYEESFTLPPRCVALDLDSGQRRVLKQVTLKGDITPEDLVAQRHWATAADGTRIPVSVVMHRDAANRHTPLPTLLYGYGAYGEALDPWFSITRLELLKYGIAFAVAHVRGGGERGEPWYLDGKLEHKENSFSDFLSARQWLVDKGISCAHRIAAYGASAGGLLVGTCVNRAPLAFCAAMLDVPFVDVLRTMQNPALPLTTAEYQEWGNPAESAAFSRIQHYSPLDNLARQPYPALYLKGSWFDARVPYWEPAKLFARINQMDCARGPVLLDTDMTAGHGGNAGRFEAWRDGARQDAFLVWALLKEYEE